MRILFISPASELGGAERCLLDCIAALRDVKPLAKVALLALADGPLVREARALDVEVQVIEPPPEFTEFGESGARMAGAGLLRLASCAPAALNFVTLLRRAMISYQPAVVHSNGMKAHLLTGMLAPARSRLVVHLHDFVGSRRVSKWALPLLAQLRPRTVFAANSHAVAEDFRRLAPKADVRTTYNVVDVSYFRPGAAEDPWLAATARLAPPDPGVVSFGLVATYARWKGHALFIEAAGKLLSAHPDLPLRFYVVGGPIYKTLGSQVSASELLAWARAARIEKVFGLVPFQDDIARVYRSLNVVVHASTEPEPFGRTIVEAMACGRPVVVSRAGGATELFQEGENALGFSTGDSTDLARAMGSLLDERTRAKLGGAGRNHAIAQFSRERLGPKLLSLYEAWT